MASRAHKYRQAAVTYFVYGLLYWLGGWYLIEVGVSMRSGTAWLLIGALFVVVFPPLIWRGFKWFTRILAVLVGIRVAGLIRVIATDDGTAVVLPGGGLLPLVVGAVLFALVAAITCAMLVRAGWDLGAREPSEDAGVEPA